VRLEAMAWRSFLDQGLLIVVAPFAIHAARDKQQKQKKMKTNYVNEIITGLRPFGKLRMSFSS
jgi:hypothetical protein